MFFFISCMLLNYQRIFLGGRGASTSAAEEYTSGPFTYKTDFRQIIRCWMLCFCNFLHETCTQLLHSYYTATTQLIHSYYTVCRLHRGFNTWQVIISMKSVSLMFFNLSSLDVLRDPQTVSSTTLGSVAQHGGYQRRDSELLAGLVASPAVSPRRYIVSCGSEKQHAEWVSSVSRKRWECYRCQSV